MTRTTLTLPLLAAAGLVATAAPAFGDARGLFPTDPTIFTSDFQVWEDGDAPVTLTLDRFDTLGGSRELTAVTFFFDAVVDMTVGVENLGDTPVDSSDYSFSFELTEQSNWSIPFSPGVLGGNTAPTPSVSLGASDGIEGSGADFHEYVFGIEDLDIFSFFEVSEEDHSAFIGTGQFTVDITPLVSFPSSPPPPFLNFDTVLHQQAVEISVQYVYSEVPAPGGVAMGALAATVVTRRRRTA